MSDMEVTEELDCSSLYYYPAALLYDIKILKCGHCKNIAPEFEKAAKTLKLAKSSLTLIEVDCSESGKDICSKYNVKSYPLLKIFKYGEVTADYKGPKHAEGIVQHLKSTVQPGSREIKTVADADTFFASIENCVIGFFEPTQTKIESEFHRLAESLKEQYRFAHTYSNRLLARYGYRNEIVIMRSVHLQNKLEPPHLKYEGEVTLYKLRSWVTEHYHGLVGIRTTVNIDDFRRPLVVVYYKLDFTGKNAKESSYWRNRVMLMARKFVEPGKKKIHFAVSDTDEFRREMTDLGLTYDGATPVVAARDAHENRYVMKSPFSTENLEKFVEDLLAGKMGAYVKSAPLPESNDGPVKTVVADNFEEVVMSSDKHVVILFHSPWCGECPELEKTFVQLSRKLNGDKIILASMDATSNDVPKQFIIKRFPAVFLAAKGAKLQPILYEGTYEVDELLKFLTDAVPEVQRQKKTTTRETTPKEGVNAVKTEL